MNETDSLGVYESILALSVSMRGAARKSQWDELAALENERYVLTKTLMASDQGGEGDSGGNAGKAALIRNILDCDVETRALAEAWRLELRQILDSVGKEKKLGNAYASFE